MVVIYANSNHSFSLSFQNLKKHYSSLILVNFRFVYLYKLVFWMNISTQGTFNISLFVIC